MKSPRVRLKARESSPELINARFGYTHIVAYTEKGPFEDTEVYTTVSRFREVYGKEVGTTTSSIERALTLGASVRVFRVLDGDKADSWIEAMHRSKDFDDAYQIFYSNAIHQLSSSLLKMIYQAAKEMVEESKDRMLFIEIPRYLGIVPWVSDLATDYKDSMGLGSSPYIAWFIGGILYDTEAGFEDCLGTVAALADSTLTNHGIAEPLYGPVRGIVPIAKYCAPVIQVPSFLSSNGINYFRPSTNRDLNLFERPTLWGDVTGNSDDSYLSSLTNVRLSIYLKKILLPILESYLEEPNTFQTWSSIAIEGQRELQTLYNQNAIAGFSWLGDQDAISYEDLQVNSEEEVRNGIYRVQVVITEQVLLTDITLELILDNQNNTIILN